MTVAINHYAHSRNKAFSLIEMSIVIIIISLIASAILTLGIKKTEASKIEVTEKHMSIVEKAIGQYVLRNGALPCPADGANAIKTATFGDAACGTNVITATTPDIIVGTVPTATLLIADSYMFDGWGRRLTYIVDARLITRSGFKRYKDPTSGTLVTKEGGITVYARGDDSTAPPTRTTTAAMVLISHGENGHGAWLKNGGTNTRMDSGSTDLAELENAHDTASDISFDEEFTQMLPTSTFDDIVHYKEYWQVIKEAGGIVDDTLCELAYRTLSYTNTSVTPVEGPVGCTGDNANICIERQLIMAQAVLDLCVVSNPAVK